MALHIQRRAPLPVLPQSRSEAIRLARENASRQDENTAIGDFQIKSNANSMRGSPDSDDDRRACAIQLEAGSTAEAEIASGSTPSSSPGAAHAANIARTTGAGMASPAPEQGEVSLKRARTNEVDVDADGAQGRTSTSPVADEAQRASPGLSKDSDGSESMTEAAKRAFPDVEKYIPILLQAMVMISITQEFKPETWAAPCGVDVELIRRFHAWYTSVKRHERDEPDRKRRRTSTATDFTDASRVSSPSLPTRPPSTSTASTKSHRRTTSPASSAHLDNDQNPASAPAQEQRRLSVLASSNLPHQPHIQSNHPPRPTTSPVTVIQMQPSNAPPHRSTTSHHSNHSPLSAAQMPVANDLLGPGAPAPPLSSSVAMARPVSATSYTHAAMDLKMAAIMTETDTAMAGPSHRQPSHLLSTSLPSARQPTIMQPPRLSSSSQFVRAPQQQERVPSDNQQLSGGPRLPLPSEVDAAMRAHGVGSRVSDLSTPAAVGSWSRFSVPATAAQVSVTGPSLRPASNVASSHLQPSLQQSSHTQLQPQASGSHPRHARPQPQASGSRLVQAQPPSPASSSHMARCVPPTVPSQLRATPAEVLARTHTESFDMTRLPPELVQHHELVQMRHAQALQQYQQPQAMRQPALQLGPHRPPPASQPQSNGAQHDRSTFSNQLQFNFLNPDQIAVLSHDVRRGYLMYERARWVDWLRELPSVREQQAIERIEPLEKYLRSIDDTEGMRNFLRKPVPQGVWMQSPWSLVPRPQPPPQPLQLQAPAGQLSGPPQQMQVQSGQTRPPTPAANAAAIAATPQLAPIANQVVTRSPSRGSVDEPIIIDDEMDSQAAQPIQPVQRQHQAAHQQHPAQQEEARLKQSISAPSEAHRRVMVHIPPAQQPPCVTSPTPNGATATSPQTQRKQIALPFRTKPRSNAPAQPIAGPSRVPDDESEQIGPAAADLDRDMQLERMQRPDYGNVYVGADGMQRRDAVTRRPNEQRPNEQGESERELLADNLEQAGSTGPTFKLHDGAVAGTSSVAIAAGSTSRTPSLDTRPLVLASKRQTVMALTLPSGPSHQVRPQVSATTTSTTRIPPLPLLARPPRQPLALPSAVAEQTPSQSSHHVSAQQPPSLPASQGTTANLGPSARIQVQNYARAVGAGCDADLALLAITSHASTSSHPITDEAVARGQKRKRLGTVSSVFKGKAKAQAPGHMAKLFASVARLSKSTDQHQAPDLETLLATPVGDLIPLADLASLADGALNVPPLTEDEMVGVAAFLDACARVPVKEDGTCPQLELPDCLVELPLAISSGAINENGVLGDISNAPGGDGSGQASATTSNSPGTDIAMTSSSKTSMAEPDQNLSTLFSKHLARARVQPAVDAWKRDNAYLLDEPIVLQRIQTHLRRAAAAFASSAPLAQPEADVLVESEPSRKRSRLGYTQSPETPPGQLPRELEVQRRDAGVEASASAGGIRTPELTPEPVTRAQPDPASTSATQTSSGPAPSLALVPLPPAPKLDEVVTFADLDAFLGHFSETLRNSLRSINVQPNS
ncbi:hypothetical protein BKA62DRAFT_714972 [Auriculariales sp. MPI-PUGE-AT-0066]|nr:hypothetical protein BKA62DRAFT_714972 [Auriculariales sp. MPI-PUGE-AT-0066]